MKMLQARRKKQLEALGCEAACGDVTSCCCCSTAARAIALLREELELKTSAKELATGHETGQVT